MNSNAEAVRGRVERARHELKCAEGALQRLEETCVHQWGPVEAAHVYHEARTIPGDPPGTMGVDWRGPCYVPASTDMRWKRTCRECGKVEYTSQTTQHVTETPRFN